MKTLLVTTYEDSGTQIGTIVKVHHASKNDPVEAIRKAANDWVRTEEGTEYNEEINGDFNWGDALTEVPNEFFGRHGVAVEHLLDGRIIVLNHDELLIEEDN